MPPQINLSNLGLTDRTIRVRLDADTMNDFVKLAAVQKDLLTQLGCPACHSGLDIRYELQREFVGRNGKLSIG